MMLIVIVISRVRSLIMALLIRASVEQEKLLIGILRILPFVVR